MSHRLRLLSLAAVAATALIAVPAGAYADGIVPLKHVGPQQYFVGLVNDKAGTSTITVVCPGPITPAETGHPVANQYVSVKELFPPVASTIGYTGESATQINVAFGNSASVAVPVTLYYYDVKVEIPTSLNLPCGGTGTVTFTPEPSGPSTTPENSARPSTVTVTYLDIAA